MYSSDLTTKKFKLNCTDWVVIIFSAITCFQLYLLPKVAMQGFQYLCTNYNNYQLNVKLCK